MGHRSVHTKKKKAPEMIRGIIRVSARGVGTIFNPENNERIEVPNNALNTALNGDEVSVIVGKRGKYGVREGIVQEILIRKTTRFVGVVEYSSDGTLLVNPDDKRVYTPLMLARDDYGRVSEGQKVFVALHKWTRPDRLPGVSLIEVVGEHGEHETEMRAIVLAAGFDYHAPEAVVAEGERIRQEQDERMRREAAKRRDMRLIPTFTIDPSDAKDFDDAISIQKRKDGTIELGIHIADVTAYISEHDPIDKEAQKRGTSIYLVDRTIPMLPEVLSNDVCSLNPNEDKLTFSAIFTLTHDHTVIEEWFGETIIRSAHRFTYENAQETLDKGSGALYDELVVARDIARTLRSARMKAGAIAFETDEIKFTLDEHMRPTGVFRKTRQETNIMIEELMLLANRKVAEYASRFKEARPDVPVPFVYRIHDKPNTDKITELSMFLEALGYELPHQRGEVTASALNALFDTVAHSPHKDLIETATIRSMAKARYSLKNIGHFGLAFSHYCHFTSPIRRYPDIMVHRTMKTLLANGAFSKSAYGTSERLAEMSSEREVAAADAERESVKFKQCEYMATKIGQEFDGIVSGIADWGVFVEEMETKAEGLIRLRDLKDDYYLPTEHGYRLVGERTGKSIGLADKVRVKLIAVDLEQKMIDWRLVR